SLGSLVPCKDDLADQTPQEPFAVLNRRLMGMPQCCDIPNKRAEQASLLFIQGREAPALLLAMFLFQLGDGAQLLVPAGFELARHQPILRLTLIILTVRAFGVIAGALQP